MKTNIICSNYISGLRNQGKIDSKILSENLTEDQIEPIKLAIFNQAFKGKLQTNIHDEPNAWFDLGGE